MLMKYSYENRSSVLVGWLPSAFHEAGISWEAIFDALDDLFVSKVRFLPSCPLLLCNHSLARSTLQIPPWHTTASQTYLVSELTYLLESWLAESESRSGAGGGGLKFPATKVDSGVGKYLMLLQVGTSADKERDGVKERLQSVQRVIRARF